jgi:hypothetical protein
MIGGEADQDREGRDLRRETAYRFYVRGMYFGAAPTRARALAAAKKALESWDFKTMKRKRRR